MALALMMALRCFHPPAGITPLIAAQFDPDWSFLLWPVLSGALLAALLARSLEALRLFPALRRWQPVAALAAFRGRARSRRLAKLEPGCNEAAFACVEV
ncbi:HPP family protein [Ancylobacter dichloromethanicus]